jgi:hypothetical protein
VLIAAYWLKPFGTTEPPRRIDPDWTAGADLENFPIMSGPASDKPPKMGRGDNVLFHAVGHVRLYAAGELIRNPKVNRDPEWGHRFPWAYRVRVDAWVPNVLDGLHTPTVAPAKAMGHLQTGGPYASLTREQYERLLDELLKLPSARRR